MEAYFNLSIIGTILNFNCVFKCHPMAVTINVNYEYMYSMFRAVTVMSYVDITIDCLVPLTSHQGAVILYMTVWAQVLYDQ